jgi:hypothetical protein
MDSSRNFHQFTNHCYEQGCTKRVFADVVKVLNAVLNAVNETLGGER